MSEAATPVEGPSELQQALDAIKDLQQDVRYLRRDVDDIEIDPWDRECDHECVKSGDADDAIRRVVAALDYASIRTKDKDQLQLIDDLRVALGR